MLSKGRAARQLRCALVRFRASRKGSAAVQFAFVAPLFFAVLFAIVEVSLVYFAGQVLETGTQDSGRQIFTHQAQDSNVKGSDFRSNLCGRVSFLMNCNLLVVDVESYPPGTVITPYIPFNGQGIFDPSKAQYSPPAGGSSNVVLVRVFYKWPLFFTRFGFNLSNLGQGTRLLSATAAFRVEPAGSGGSSS